MDSLLSQFKEIVNLIKLQGLSEVMTNPDGRLWIEEDGTIKPTEYVIEPQRVYSIIRLLAGHYDLIVNRENPTLSVKLPLFQGGRFQALVPPIVEAPTFSIRFPPKKIFTLDDLLQKGSIQPNEYEQLKNAVNDRKTILIAGGTGSGKTTVANALLNQVTDDRLIIIEDNPEIRSSSPNSVHILTNINFGLRDAVKAALRLRPDRIIIGEIRDGGTAIDFLKASQTGHPGSIGTIHATSADQVKSRIYSLMQEEVVQPSEELIKEAINMIVFVQKIFIGPTIGPTEVIRKVTEIKTKF